MDKHPAAISRRELIRKFRRLGFAGPFSGGRHQFMVRGPLKVRIPNPHSGKDIHVGLVREILRQAGISSEMWENA
ncbi:MAG: type II toxin-antitoxin system HicA family toxin [Planctomycetes bacterium]|nr:type II toxin-antitoxin system HicA family toxin [Planctomycetota bacterium]